MNVSTFVVEDTAHRCLVWYNSIAMATVTLVTTESSMIMLCSANAQLHCIHFYNFIVYFII